MVQPSPMPSLLHVNAPLAPHDLWTADAWSPEPTVLFALLVSAWLYARGTAAVWRRGGPGRGIRYWQVACFAAGLLALFLALVSPLDALALALFWAHMVQHLLLVLVAAPLLVLGTPLIPLAWSLPTGWLGRLRSTWRPASPLAATWHALTHPIVAWVLYIGAVLAWHLPALYQAAVRDEAVHVLEHVSFLGAALLFWWTAFHGCKLGRLSYGAGVLYLAAAMAVGSGLGALMTFSRTPWYRVYESSSAAWGLTPLEDQQLAGLLMWMPAGMVYVLAAAALLALWLRAAERTHPLPTDALPLALRREGRREG